MWYFFTKTWQKLEFKNSLSPPWESYYQLKRNYCVLSWVCLNRASCIFRVGHKSVTQGRIITLLVYLVLTNVRHCVPDSEENNPILQLRYEYKENIRHFFPTKNTLANLTHLLRVWVACGVLPSIFCSRFEPNRTDANYRSNYCLTAWPHAPHRGESEHIGIIYTDAQSLVIVCVLVLWFNYGALTYGQPTNTRTMGQVENSKSNERRLWTWPQNP